MEMKPSGAFAYEPSGSDLVASHRVSQSCASEASPPIVEPTGSLLASVAFATSVFLTAPTLAAAMPHFGTSPLVEDRREVVTVAVAARASEQSASYRQILVQPFGQQAKQAMAALSITKSQLAGVLRVSRPTVYEWLAGKDPNPSNAARLTTVLRILARAGISSEMPLNARFVRHAIHERSASLLDLLSADELDESSIEDMLREVVALGQEAEKQRESRENRLRSLGYDEQSPEQRRDQLNRTVALLDWPK